jgi:DNA polymerase-3 subunit alpha (Gram-positive type)
MNSPAENQKRFELVLKQADMPAPLVEAFFRDGVLDHVATSRKRREWTFCVRKKELLPRNIYEQLCSQLKARFADSADVSVRIDYGAMPAGDIVREYWPCFIEWVTKEIVSVNGWLAKAQLDVREDELHVGLPDEPFLQIAEKKGVDKQIRRYFSERFALPLRVKFRLDANRDAWLEHFEERKLSEEKQAVEIAMNEPAGEPEPQAKQPERLAIGKEIREAAVPISSLHEEENQVVAQGEVFKIEGTRELKNGSLLVVFYVTDMTDSITVKLFARSKEDRLAVSKLKEGLYVKLRGKTEFDRFSNPPELVLVASDLVQIDPPPMRMDDAEEKRVEFHLHTAMSAMDGITEAGKYIERAAKWGHKAIAITDHSNVQAYPDANKAAKKYGIKVLYGVEANLVPDGMPIVLNPADKPLSEAEYVVFDVETTGLSVINNKLIEIAAVKFKGGKETGRFATFVNPQEPIPRNIQELTHITDDMVKDAPLVDEALPRFLEFAGDGVLVAHNARFDIGFIQEFARRLGLPRVENPVLDTLELARALHPGLKNHRLNTLADKYKVTLDNHHRAVDDAAALGGILLAMLKEAMDRGAQNLNTLNDLAAGMPSNARPFHANIYALNVAGKKRLFKLISLSHTEHYNRQPTIPKSLLAQMREGLLITSGCEKGEFFETVLNKSREEAEACAEFYDVLEIQPPEMYRHLVDKGLVGSEEDIKKALAAIVEIGEKTGKPVIATGNVHYLDPHEHIFRDITIHGITGYSPLKEITKPKAHFRTTKEMLEAFRFLGEETAYRVVVTNTNELADRFEPFELFPKTGGPTNNGLFSPIIEGADEEIREKCYATARDMYGDPLPDIVAARLEKELKPIIQYGFSANYLISERLVKKSNADGYLVGSRGSVGSSFVATALGISEVNPLPPHYRCRKCKHSEWFTDGSIPSGFDLPDKPCPKCGETMKGDGQDIPFETFLGFKGDKVPDIDLNFSGEYQPIAHNYTKELFGEKNVFRAGTIGTVAEKTAFGFVKKYEEDHGKRWRTAEVLRLAKGCTGVKRSTGQHPGGIVVVPDYIEVEDITPVQYPADDTSSEWKTTHFDYHAYDENLLKLDILGHDDPTMMRMLHDLTGVDPTTIPMNDPKVMSIFSSTEAIGVTPEQIRSKTATYGVPEMGTRFVRQMLEETKPKSFADLLQISGLSHGTGVWLGNAQELIRNGTCTISTVIGCRDDIMLYLIYKAGMDASLAFKITESVRKGRGLTPEWIEDMRKAGVPQWYIDSCQKIEYMFPKAHAAAYVISAVRTAYYKVYHPLAFYAAYFSVRATDFDIDVFRRGYDAIMAKLEEIEAKGFQATPKEKSMVSILEMGLEMTSRGFGFTNIDLYRSDATRFQIDGNNLLPPFSSVPGIGENAAKNIAAARKDGEFLSVEDFQLRTKSTKTVVELLANMGCFRGLPESNQLSLF